MGEVRAQSLSRRGTLIPTLNNASYTASATQRPLHHPSTQRAAAAPTRPAHSMLQQRLSAPGAHLELALQPVNLGAHGADHSLACRGGRERGGAGSRVQGPRPAAPPPSLQAASLHQWQCSATVQRNLRRANAARISPNSIMAASMASFMTCGSTLVLQQAAMEAGQDVVSVANASWQHLAGWL